MIKEHLDAIFFLYIYIPLVNAYALYLQLELKLKVSYLKIIDYMKG